MSYTVRIKTTVDVWNSSNDTVTGEQGGTVQTITATGEDVYRVTTTVADNYTKVTLWENGDGGVADFDFLYFVSDAAVLLELVEDRAGTPLYSTLSIAANVPFILSTDDVQNVASTTTVQSTTDTIDGIYVQNNAAEAAGDATVTLILVT